MEKKRNRTYVAAVVGQQKQIPSECSDTKNAQTTNLNLRRPGLGDPDMNTHTVDDVLDSTI